MRSFDYVRPATIADAGHMMHHERPEELAAVIAPFLEGRP